MEDQSITIKPEAIDESADESWVSKHKKYLLTAAFAGAAALSLTEFNTVLHDVEQNAEWLGSAIGTTEAVAWSGAGMMLVSTGNKLGNPLTVKKRLNEIKDKLSASRLYRSGAYLSLGGAIGTSSLIIAETVRELPVSSWPLALGTAAVSTAVALPSAKIARRREQGEEEQ